MNILALSDTHGKTDGALALFDRVSSFANIDLIVHCGDLSVDAGLLAKKCNVEVVSVPGNCDGCRERVFKIVDMPSGRMLVIHGHSEGVKTGLTNLLYLAEQEGCNAVCFGHTHVALNETIGGIRVINPGSASNPRDKESGSCALICSEGTHIAASIIRL